MRIYLTLFFCLISLKVILGQTALITSGFTWKYFDLGDVNDPNWNTLSYNDANWNSGQAELGYGDGDENTTVGYGNDANNKHITTYFRTTINVINPQQYTHLALSMKRDDGAVVYINGNEVWRSNMPNGTIAFSTPADGTVAWPNEDDWHNINISAAYLVNGQNVVAVEVHQENGSSSDVSFNFTMIAHSNLNATVTRGPYLQKVNQNSIILRWRTDVPTDTRVEYGISPANLSNSTIQYPFTTEHEVQLTGLNAATNYYYSIGTAANVLQSGNNLFFETMPMEGVSGDYQFLVLGDCGTGYQEQVDVKTAVVSEYGNHFDGILLLGDNAYQSGFDSEYQSNFFGNQYKELFENTVIWPAPGNHDYNNHIPFSPSPAYYNIFNCPTTGECGGLASGTEKYYSYNYGNIHFISLDSYDEPRSSSAAMATWLLQDLQSNTLPWIVAYWHHPPYTKGSHDSDNDNFLDGELVEMREEIIPILEQFGVDLILNGHSHSYERSKFIDGHYGNSSSFSQNHIIQPGGGNYPIECPYHKNLEMGNSHNGTVYCVIGNSGKTSSPQSDWPHPAMFSYTASEVGAIILKIVDNRLDATFYTASNEVFDHYTIVKRNGNTQVITTCINEELTLFPTWPNDQLHSWHPGNTFSNSFTITPISDGTIIGTDQQQCIADTFNITVLQNDTCGYLMVNEILVDPEFTATYYKQEIIIQNNTFDGNYSILNSNGQIILTVETKDENPIHIPFKAFPSGTYFVRNNSTLKTKKILKHD